MTQSIKYACNWRNCAKCDRRHGRAWLSREILALCIAYSFGNNNKQCTLRMLPLPSRCLTAFRLYENIWISEPNTTFLMTVLLLLFFSKLELRRDFSTNYYSRMYSKHTALHLKYWETVDLKILSTKLYD